MALHALPRIQISIALLMLFQVSALLMRSFVEMQLGASGMDPQSARYTAALCGFAMLAILLWPLLRNQPPHWRALFRQPGSWARLMLASIGIGILVRLAGWGFAIAWGALDPAAGRNPAAAFGPMIWWHCPGPAVLLQGILVMAVITPLLEEYLNRGLILCTLLRGNRLFAVALSAPLFAVLHPPGGMLLALAFGIIAALQMLSCRTLWGPLAAHASYNLIALLDTICLQQRVAPAHLPAELGLATGMAGSLLLCLAALLARLPVPGRCPAPAQDRPGSIP